MIKPKILSAEKIKQAIKEAISKQGWLDITVKQRYQAVAQAQNDYCYQEMLGQFEEWMRTLLDDPELQDCRGAIGFIGLTIHGELLALQGLEEG